MPTLNYGTRQGSPGFVGPPRPSSGFQFGGGVSTNTADTYSQQEVDVKAPKRTAYDIAQERIAAGIAPRVDMSKEQLYCFPEDLRTSADTGYPFIMFSVEDAKGTGKVDICLYQPPGVAVSDGANYTGYDMGQLKGIVGLGKALSSREGITDADIFSLSLMAKDKLTSSGTVDKITSAATVGQGIASNPYTRTAYESTNIRTFGFTFKLIAESAEESETAKNIERTFRKFLYPKRSGSIALSYPPLFRIRFFANRKINPYMPVIKPCYLTSVETTFNGGAVSIHKGTQAPVEVYISLSFQEERVLVRQDLYETDDTTEEHFGYYKDGQAGGAIKTDQQQAQGLTAKAIELLDFVDKSTGG